ncbi:MAG TPA: hypothetical protein VFL83_15330 [Anaeromyxobacter sp.]|nr:hypothetical protein [Anaeromyxobacter sp.]
MRWIALAAMIAVVRPAAAEQPEPRSTYVGPEQGFLVDLRIGVALPVAYPTTGASVVVPVTFGLGWRFRSGSRALAVVEGVPGDFGERAPDPSGAEASGFGIVLGLEIARPLERVRGRPLIGVLAGLQGLSLDDVRAGVAQAESWFGWVVRGTADLPVQLGRLELGLYVAAEVGGWLDHELDVSGVSTALPVGQALHGMISAGVRIGRIL